MKAGLVCLHLTVSEESSWDEIFIKERITPLGLRESRPVTLHFRCVYMCSVITGFPLTDSHWPKSPFNPLRPCLGSERVLSIDEMRRATSSADPSSQMETYTSNRRHIYNISKGIFIKAHQLYDSFSEDSCVVTGLNILWQISDWLNDWSMVFYVLMGLV